jgi:hypothetical protein
MRLPPPVGLELSPVVANQSFEPTSINFKRSQAEGSHHLCSVGSGLAFIVELRM